MSLLEVTDLRVSFVTADGVVQAVRGVSLTLERGQTLGVVGESGSGKSVAFLALLGLNQGADTSGDAMLGGRNLLTMDEAGLRRVRGAEIAMVFQDPLTSLHPQYRVGWQIAEMVRAHTDADRAQAQARAVELLGMVGIPQPGRRVDDYPHEFSGGMRQRAMIAMALACDPEVLIADEPTTALDATVSAQILDLLGRLQAERDMALVVITHDLGVVAEVADDVLVMYAGKAVEHTDRRTLFHSPHHPYTCGLLDSVPSAGSRSGRLRPIRGQPPSLITVPPGCAFHPRCRFEMDACRREIPPLAPVTGGPHRSACLLPPDLVGTSDEVEAARLAVAEEHRPAGLAAS